MQRTPLPTTGTAHHGKDAAELLRACAQGDRFAFRTLYDGWAPQMHGIALRVTRQPSLAADATHDAFVQIWQQADRFDSDRGSAEAFLITIVRYRALDIVRRRGREIPGYEPPEQKDDAPDALSRMVTTSEGAALHRCLDLLDAERRKLVVMAFVDGLTHNQIAEHVRIPLGTIKSTIRRCLSSLRECLAS